MAFHQDHPSSFQAALKLAERLLSRSETLVKRGLVPAEAEQIVTAAYRKATRKKLGRAELFVRINDRFPAEAGELVIIWAAARAEGKTLQHLIGYQVFLDHEYDVGPEVLVPRPETELMVAHAIETLGKTFSDDLRLGLEIGIGSGAISIELLSAFPALRMLASELTETAEACAIRNAERILGRAAGDRLKIFRAPDPRSVWKAFGARQGQFLISNPPYMTKSDGIDADVLQHEPHSALFAPEDDPLHFYRAIATEARKHLVPGALIFLEIPSERAAPIAELFAKAGLDPSVSKDLNGRDRILNAKVGT